MSANILEEEIIFEGDTFTVVTGGSTRDHDAPRLLWSTGIGMSANGACTMELLEQLAGELPSHRLMVVDNLPKNPDARLRKLNDVAAMRHALLETILPKTETDSVQTVIGGLSLGGVSFGTIT